MTIAMPSITQAIEETFRDESSKVLAALIGKFNDFELAEEVVQEAFIIALEKWQDAGIPPNPGGWIMTTAPIRPSTYCDALIIFRARWQSCRMKPNANRDSP